MFGFPFQHEKNYAAVLGEECLGNTKRWRYYGALHLGIDLIGTFSTNITVRCTYTYNTGAEHRNICSLYIYEGKLEGAAHRNTGKARGGLLANSLSSAESFAFR